MSDLADMLGGLLSDPKTSDKLRALLDTKPDPPEQASTSALLPDGLDPATLIKITRVMQRMNSSKDNERTRLLCDLKPYMSNRRVKRVDEAIEILKLIDILDMFREGGE